MNAAARARRLLRTASHRRVEPWGSNFVAAQLLAYALGVREEPVSDRDYRTVARPGRADRYDFATDARQVPLALARVLALAKEGRTEEASELLGEAFGGLDAFTAPTAPEPKPEPEVAPEPAPAEAQDTGPAGAVEVVQSPAVDEVNDGGPTLLPHNFPERAALADNGFETIEAVTAATDAELRAISGIGPAKVSLIRAAITVIT